MQRVMSADGRGPLMGLINLFGLFLNCLFLLLLTNTPLLALADKLQPIYWNSSNPIFRIDNSEHVRSVRIRDTVTIYCPNYGPLAATGTPVASEKIEYSKIYRVPRWSYDRCVLTKQAELLGICRNPFGGERISLVVRSFTPVPNGLEFKPGHSYYFISTSNGTLEGMNARKDGLCLTKNMKFIFEIQSDQQHVRVGAVKPPPDTGKSPSSGHSGGGGRIVGNVPKGASQPDVVLPVGSGRIPVLSNPSGSDIFTHRNSDRRRPPDGRRQPNPRQNDGDIPVGNERPVVDGGRRRNDGVVTTTPIWYIVHTYPPGSGGNRNDFQGYRSNNNFDDIADGSSMPRAGIVVILLSFVAIALSVSFR